MPRPFEPQLGADIRALFPDLSKSLQDVLSGIGGSSPYLAGLMRKEMDWIKGAVHAPFEALESELRRAAQSRESETAASLRCAKRRIALLAGICDLAGVWTLEEVTGALTRLAETACQVALRAALAPFIRRGKIPGLEDVNHSAGLFVLAMGKMGAGELNYSSDIDLICLFDPDQLPQAAQEDARSVLIKAVRQMCRLLSDTTADGYVFRTDLRLRPNPSVTPIVLSVPAAETYYESQGRTWERAAFIKARPIAGDIKAGEAFLRTLTPFVWRKHLDFAAIEDAHNIRLAIRDHKGTGGALSLPGHDMKLGRGGIREIEFFTQTRQLIAGGRAPQLRVRQTVQGLKQLAAGDWISEQVAQKLSAEYRFQRGVEHRLQMLRDAQTHSLPQNEEEFERLACLSGQELGAMKEQIRASLSEVHDITESFFAPNAAGGSSGSEILPNSTVTRWLSYPALRSPRARSILDRLVPVLSDRLSKAQRPTEALSALDEFLSSLPAGVQVLSLFEANPGLIDLVLDVVSISPALADYLSHNASVLDAVLDGGFFADIPDQAALTEDLSARLGAEADYEARLGTARRWQKEQHFRIGVHLLRGLVAAEQASQHYADLARAVLAALWPHVQDEFARKHGRVAGGGAAVLGMGALGAGRMNAQSDLDLIVIYDAQSDAASDGRRCLPARTYFARLTKALITALSARMPDGRLYEVDMRLRPSGNQGPVATSWASFQDYQANEAWSWEHLALTRARVVAGPERLTEQIEAFRSTVLAGRYEPGQLAVDVGEMRVRIAAAKTPVAWWDVKRGPGRLQDVELLAQCGALLQSPAPIDVQDGLSGLAGALGQGAQAQMMHSYGRARCVLLAVSLMQSSGEIGPTGQAFLLRLTGFTSLSDLQDALERDQKETGSLIEQALQRMRQGDA